MDQIIFEWDAKKDKINLNKHDVSFEEAKSVFYDEYAIFYFDPEHSENEDRFLLLGMSFKLKTLVICHCFRQEEKIVRIISARKADKSEEKVYWRDRK
ncbi:MAG: BrnT family toxin [Spirochaetaceae bacterium]|nr:BrnT family toxin [Spirochaetaceae bacterium]